MTARADGATPGGDAPAPGNRAGRRRAAHGRWGVPVDGNGRARVKARAWAMRRATRPGKHYGEVTAKQHDVLLALDALMDHRTGACFPSLEALADAAGCARSTAQLAVAALRRLGLVTWLTRYERRLVDVVDGTTGRVERRLLFLRTSNAYALLDLGPGVPTRPSDAPDWRPVAARPSWRDRVASPAGPETESRSGSREPARAAPAAVARRAPRPTALAT